jgi:HK97 family phage major capsid protein
MRKINDIKKEISDNLLIVKNQESEQETRVASLEKLDALNLELKGAYAVDAAERSMVGRSFSENEKKEASRFSFAKFLREASEGNLTGLEAEMAQEAKNETLRNGQTLRGLGIPTVVLESRDAAPAAGQNVTAPADGGRLVNTEPITYIEALRKKLVLAQLGAKYLPGLVGNVPFVTGSTISAAWGSEFEALNTVAKAAFSIKEMTPKRLAVNTAFSRQLLNQTGGEIERILMDEMIAAHAGALEAAAIQGGGTSEPVGILGTSGIGAVAMGVAGAAITWAKLVELETKINTANANMGSLNYLTNSKVVGGLKTIERSVGTARFLLENGQSNGYPVVATNHVPSNLTKVHVGGGAAGADLTIENLSAMIFGNFEDLYIGQWGGLDIVVDPYSLKKTGQIETTINAFHDVLVRRPASFAAIKDIIAS